MQIRIASITFALTISRQKKERKENEKKTAADSFMAAANNFIEEARLERRPSTVNNYRAALHSFSRFQGGDTGSRDITAATIRRYAKWLDDRGVCPNTTSCYMRSLRRIMTGIGIDTTGLFKDVFTGNARTAKRAAEAADIKRMEQLKPRKGPFMALARDLFLFSFYALGMPFVDMAYLRHEQISGGYLTYNRRKTGQTVRVKIEPCMQRIIDRWSKQRHRAASPYVFPILTTEEPATADRQRRQQLNRYNRALKALASQAGINTRLTSYTPRHTWASMAYSKNVELPVITQAMGHTNPQTTLIYIREIDCQRLNKANQAVIGRRRKDTARGREHRLPAS